MGRARNINTAVSTRTGSKRALTDFNALLGPHRGRSPAERKLEAERARQRLQKAVARLREIGMSATTAVESENVVVREAGAFVIGESLKEGDLAVHGLVIHILENNLEVVVDYPHIVEGLAARLAADEVRAADVALLGTFLNWAELVEAEPAEPVVLKPLMAPTTTLIEKAWFDLSEITRAACEFPENYPRLLAALADAGEDGNAIAISATATALSCAPNYENKLLAPLMRQWRQRLMTMPPNIKDHETMLGVLDRYRRKPLGELGNIVDAWERCLPTATAEILVNVLSILSQEFTFDEEETLSPTDRGYSGIVWEALRALAKKEEWWRTPKRNGFDGLAALLEARDGSGQAASEACEFARMCAHVIAETNDEDLRRACAAHLRAKERESKWVGEHGLETLLDHTPEFSLLASTCAESAAVAVAAQTQEIGLKLWGDNRRDQRTQTAAEAAANFCRSEYRLRLLGGDNPEELLLQDATVSVLVDYILADRKGFCKQLAARAPSEWEQLRKIHGLALAVRDNSLYGLLDKKMLEIVFVRTLAAQGKGRDFDIKSFAEGIITDMSRTRREP